MANVPTVQLVQPPAMVRPRESSADEKLVAALVAQIDKGWASYGFAHKDKKKVSNQAGVYRRAVIRAVKGDSKSVKSRVWKREDGQWTFALRRNTK